MAGAHHSRNLQDGGKKEKGTAKMTAISTWSKLCLLGHIKDKDFSCTIPGSILTFFFLIAPHPSPRMFLLPFNQSGRLRMQKEMCKAKMGGSISQQVEEPTYLRLEEVLELGVGRGELWQGNFRVSAEVFMSSSRKMRGFPLLLSEKKTQIPKKVIWRIWE